MAGGTLYLRRALSKDAFFFWRLRNEADTRRASLNTGPISWEKHKEWFQRALSDPNMILTVLCNGSRHRLGYMRFDRKKENHVFVSIALAKKSRGKGYGSKGLRKASAWIGRVWPCSRVQAYIKTGNTASLRAFVAAGFESLGTRTVQKCRVYLLEKAGAHAH